MNSILLPVAALAATGGLLGLIVGIVDKFMHVPVNELFSDIREVLPGVNCGACGYVGCDGYADGLAEGKEKTTTLCVPGGGEVANKIAGLLGVDAGEVVPVTAVVHCGGTCDKTTTAYEYHGPKTCKECSTFYDGQGVCHYGCIGFGDCVTACIYDAIYMCNGVPVVDKERCVGCGMCAKECPHTIISMARSSAEVHVACSSIDKGGEVRKKCSAGCIGCSRCVKECEFDAIKVENFLASIDPEKCTNCQKCVEVCPTKCINIYALDSVMA